MKNLSLSEYLNPPALIEEKKKYLNFKIVPIGGPLEIARWRLEQENKMAAMSLLRQQKMANVADTLAGPNAPLGELTWQGKAFLADQDAWDRRLAWAKYRINTYMKFEPPLPSIQGPSTVIEETPPLFSRILLKGINFLKKFYSNANF